MTKRFFLITGFFSIIALFVQFWLTWISWLLGSIIQIIFYSLVATAMIFLMKKWHDTFRYHFIRSCLIFTSIFWVFSAILLIFILYQNLVPWAVGKIILSNGKKEIVFYQMSHIAFPHFYDRVNKDLQILSHSGSIVYTEWVLPGTPVNRDRFDALLGIKMTGTLYAKFASTLGLQAQDQRLYTGVLSGSIENVDISIDDIMKLVGTGIVTPIREPLDIEAELSSVDFSNQWFLLSPLLRAVLNYSIKNDGSLESMAELLSPELFTAILHDRNVHIVSRLEADTHSHFALVYGALHFQGIYTLLRSHDSNWKILSISPLYPYSP